MEVETPRATRGHAFSLTTIASKLGSHKVMDGGPASYAKAAELKYKTCGSGLARECILTAGTEGGG